MRGRKWSPGLVLVLAAIVAPALFGCHVKESGSIRLMLLTNGDSPFWDPMRKGMEEVAAELHCQAQRQSPPGAEHNAQKRIFDDAVASGVAGIAVSPIQSDAFAPVIDRAVSQGIPVITFDSDSEKSKRLAYIGTNNYEAGRRAGDEAVKLFPRGGKLIAFVGNMGAQNARDRYRGFLDAVKGHGIEMLQGPFEDDKDRARAQRNVADAITRYGDKINGLLGLYSYNGPAIVTEVVKAGIRSKVKVLCFDGEPQTLKALQAGLVDFTVVQKPYQFGRLCTRLLYLTKTKGFDVAMQELKPELNALGMRVSGNVIDTGVDVVTPKNATEFIRRLHEKGLEST
jgi:ribose transport system substrate-binding protein